MRKNKKYISMLLSFVLIATSINVNASGYTSRNNTNILMEEATVSDSGIKLASNASISEQDSDNNTNTQYQYNGNTYEIISQSMNWTDAEEYCETLGGHLVTITDENEEAFLESIIENYSDKSILWVGLSDYEEEGNWKWITNEPTDYVRWAKGQPNNGGNEDYAALAVKRNSWSDVYEWNDYTNSGSSSGINNFGFICEWESFDINISPAQGSTLTENTEFNITLETVQDIKNASFYYSLLDENNWIQLDEKAYDVSTDNIAFDCDLSRLINSEYKFKLVMTTAKRDTIERIFEPYTIEIDKNTFNQNRYEVFETSMTWLEAKEYCESLGGHLATITSAEEQDFIANTILKTHSKGYYWLGATDEVTEGTWKWITGEEWEYTNWRGGQPDNNGDEDYLHLHSDTKKWNDLNINASRYFGLSNFGLICEWESNGINSISPLDNSVLSANPTFSISMGSSQQLANFSVYYKAIDSKEWIPIESKTLSGSYAVTQFTWHTENISSGKYDVKFVVTDASGTEYIKVYTYNLQTREPSSTVLEGTPGNLAVNLSWSNPDDDIAYYKVYRSRTSEDYRYLGKTEATSYIDEELSSEITYNYYIVAVNEYGNSSKSNIVSVKPEFVDTVAPKANAGLDTTGIVGEEITFIGSNSTDNVGIVSYLWNFGDGTTSTEADPIHIYNTVKDSENKDYDYTVTLTVTDAAGLTSSDTVVVSVYPEDQIGILNITVKDKNGKAIPDAYIYADFADGTDKYYFSDSKGKVRIVAMAGNYNFSAYKASYLPAEENFAVVQYQETNEEIILGKGEVVTAETKIKPMTKEEIVEAGIDVTDPDNQYVYTVDTELVFEQKKKPLPPVVVSGDGTIHSGGGTVHLGGAAGGGVGGGYTAGGGGTVTVVAVPSERPEIPPILAYLYIPASASWLKEFFNVSVIIDNNALPQFVIQDPEITLELPEGLSLAQTSEPQELNVKLNDIEGQQKGTAEWIVRGDTSGTYNINASFSGVMMPFEADLKANFLTENAITVYGEKALYVSVYPDSTAFIGEKYHVRYSIKNRSNKPLYNFAFSFGGVAQYGTGYKLKTEKEAHYLPFLTDGDSVYIDELSPGNSISLTYETTIAFDGDPDEVYYKLIDKIVCQSSDGEFENVPVEVIPVESQLEKANAIEGAKYVQDIGVLMGQEEIPFELTYNSMIDDIGDFGQGWMLSGIYRIEKSENDYILVLPDGTKYTFSPDYRVKPELEGEEVVVNVNSMILNGYIPYTRGSKNYKLDVTGSGFTVTTGDKAVITFDKNGNMTSYTDKQGGGLSVSGSSGMRISDINSGNYLNAYRNEDGYISKLTDTTGTFDFVYADGLLTSMTTPDNGVIDFDYTDDTLTGITKHNNGSSLHYSYEYDNGRLVKITDPMGKSKTYSYDDISEYRRIIVDETNRLGYHSIKKFDRFGELVSFEDQSGNTTYYTYDDNGNMTSVIDPNGSTIIYAYDNNDNLVNITDAEGMVTKYAYDDNNNLVSETDANGNTASYVYDDKNFLVSSKDKNGNVTSYTYDEYGNMLTVSSNGVTSKNTYEDCLLKTSTDFNGNTTVYNYTDWVLTSTVDAMGGITSYDHDDYMRVNKITYPDGTTEQWYYNCLGNLEIYTDKNGISTAYGYNNNNDLIMVTADYVKNGANDIISHYTYDDEQQLLSFTDFEGNKTTYEYDKSGQLVKSTDGNNNTTEYTYDKAGRRISEAKGDSINKYTYFKTGRINSVTDSLDNTTNYSYDNAGNLISQRDALGNTTVYTYDKNGNMIKVASPMGHTNNYTYDFRNNVKTFTDANGNVAAYTYDNNGNKIQETYNGDITVKYVYDKLNRLASATDPNGNITKYDYDKAGNVINTLTPAGIKIRYTYDGNGNVKRVYNSSDTLVQSTDYDIRNNPMIIKDALGNTTRYNYNSIGEMMSYTTPRGNTYNYTYDGNGNVLTETDPMDGVVAYDYNAFNTATSFTDANNNTTSYEYDLLNRLTSETSATGDSDSYVYNALSLLTDYTNKRGQNVHYVYDKDGRITNRTAVEGSTAYTYDNNGNLLTITDDNGTITREYDSLNRVISYTNTNGDTIGYEYDKVGNLTKLTYPDSKEVTYTYNADNQMTSVTDWNGHKTTYTYDENGRLKSISRPDGSVETYTYNEANQLIYASDKKADGMLINEYSYEYDADGNIINETSLNEPDSDSISVDDADMGYSAANQLTNFNGTAISYDADGNMLNTPLGNKWADLTYNSLNYLTDVTVSGGAVTSYTYDAEDYRTAKSENGTITNFVVSPNAELSQVLMSTKDGETTYYVYGLGLISQENAYGYKLYHYDYRGSTTAVTDLDGNVTDTVYYDAYGNIISRTGTTETPFLYVGEYGVETDNNGLYYMRARYYNPAIQRFINVDPIEDGYNWYGYVKESPVKLIDPSGLAIFVSLGDESKKQEEANETGIEVLINLSGYPAELDSNSIIENNSGIKSIGLLFDRSGKKSSNFMTKESQIMMHKLISDPSYICTFHFIDGSETGKGNRTEFETKSWLNADVSKLRGPKKCADIYIYLKSLDPATHKMTKETIYAIVFHEVRHAYGDAVGILIPGEKDMSEGYVYFQKDKVVSMDLEEALVTGIIDPISITNPKNQTAKNFLDKNGFKYGNDSEDETSYNSYSENAYRRAVNGKFNKTVFEIRESWFNS